MKISQRKWLLLTRIKWILIAVALPAFRLPYPPAYSSIFLFVAMFGHFGLEHSTGIHWKQLEKMRKASGPRWLSILENLLGILALIGGVIFTLQWFDGQSPAEMIANYFYFLISAAGWFISHHILTDHALNQWFKRQNQV